MPIVTYVLIMPFGLHEATPLASNGNKWLLIMG